jgi:hypothetical protein
MNKKIKTVADLIRNLRSDSKKRGPVWFRGHADEKWALLPSYDRLGQRPPETELLNRFRQDANLLVSQDKPRSDFDWMFLMQHYGVPTRLLDWTESPLTALFFALEQKHIKKNGALWLLFPHELNNYSNLKDKNYIPAFEEADFLGNYSVTQYAKGTSAGILPLAAIATRNSPRIQAQMGVFTISHQAKTPIDEIEDKTHVIKYEIPAASKTSLLEELSILRISDFQLFPELPTIGKTISQSLK